MTSVTSQCQTILSSGSRALQQELPEKALIYLLGRTERNDDSLSSQVSQHSLGNPNEGRLSESMASQVALIKKFQAEMKKQNFFLTRPKKLSNFLKVLEKKLGEIAVRNTSKVNIHLKSWGNSTGSVDSLKTLNGGSCFQRYFKRTFTYMSCQASTLRLLGHMPF